MCDKISDGAKFVLLDGDAFSEKYDKKDEEEIMSAFLKLLSEKFLGRDIPLFLMWNREHPDETLDEDSKVLNEYPQKLFLVNKI